MIALGGGERWPATGWLFCWVVGFLAMNVKEQQLAADIDRVRAIDSGLLELPGFGPEADREMRELLSCRLVLAAEECFPPAMPGRVTALRLLRELAALAAESHLAPKSHMAAGAQVTLESYVDGRSAAESVHTAQVTNATYQLSRTAPAGL